MIRIDVHGINNLNKLNDHLNQNKINLILFAETHGAIMEGFVQKKLLENLKPNVVLYELLEDKALLSEEDYKSFFSNDGDKNFSIISKYSELQLLVSFAKKLKIPIIGCDLKNTGRKNTDFLNKQDWNDKEVKLEEELMEKRERKQYEKIVQYLNKNFKVFASIGLYHLRQKSLLMQLLGDRKFIIIFPAFKSGKSFGETLNFDKRDVYHKIQENEAYLNGN